MLRRSLAIFAGFTLLALALTLAYALLGLSGPETVLRDAERALAEGDTLAALNALNHVDRKLGPGDDSDTCRRMLRLRAQAYGALENDRLAAVDLRRLAELAPDDVEVGLELTRLLITTGSPDEALDRARRRLRDEPGDARALELAGEALQATYQEELGRLLTDLGTVVPPSQLDEAAAALRPHLYLAASEPRAARGKARFDAILSAGPQGAQSAGRYQPLIKRIRWLISQSQDYFRRSLAAGGTPVGAYRGYAYALRQGGRDDEALALSEVYLHRFDHELAAHAVLELARIHLEAGRHRAVVEAIDRHVPPDSWAERLRAEDPAPELGPLLLCKARALRAMDRADELGAMVAQLAAVAAAGAEAEAGGDADGDAVAADGGEDPAEDGVELPPEATLVEAYYKELAEGSAGVEALLGPFIWRDGVRDPPATGEDYLVEAMQLRLAAAARTKASAGHRGWLCQQWMERRPEDPRPYRERARLRLSQEPGGEAFADAATYLERMGQDDEALSLYAEAADRLFALSGRDAAALLRHARQLDGELPAAADDALYLPLARAALDAGAAEVALRAAVRAAQLFPWARQPRYLWAEAARAVGDSRQELLALAGLRKHHPDDARGLELLCDARRRAGQPVDDLLYELALARSASAPLAAALLRSCLRRQDWQLGRRFASRAAARFGDDPEVLVAVTDVLSASGERARAARLLLPMFELLFRRGSDMAAPVAKRYLELAAAARQDAVIPLVAPVATSLHAGDAAALLEMAAVLEENRYAAAALDVLRPLLTEDRHAGPQRAEALRRAGRLWLQRARWADAQRALTGALALQEDGCGLRPLAMLLVHAGRLDDAAQAYWEERADNLASAALLLRLGRGEAADAWIEAALRDDPFHVQAMCLRALRAGAAGAAAAPPAIRALVEGAPELLLEAIAFADEPGFAELAQQRAAQLRERFAGNPVADLLWAHALAQAGQPQQALAELDALAAGGRFTAALVESVRILQQTDPARLEQPELQERVAAVVTTSGAALPPLLRAVALQGVAARMARAGGTDPATLDALAALWTSYPAETGAGLPQVKALLGYGRPRDALRLLDVLERRLADAERPAFATAFGELAQSAIAGGADAETAEALRRRARRLIDSDGAYGSLVHVALGERAAAGGTREDADRRRAEVELLERHLELFRAHRDLDVGALVRTLWRLAAWEGRDATLQRVEELLRADASLVDVWLVRAALLEASGRLDEAAAGLRWLLDYCDSDSLVVEYSRLVAAGGTATAADEDRLLRIDAATAATPAAAAARGLMALRMARYREAADLLAEAPKRHDGSHLFFRALALLSVGETPAVEQAARLLRQLQREHGDSRLAETAGNLATQLELPTEPKA